MGPAWGIWALPIALRKVAEAVPKGSHPGRQTQDSGAVATSRQGIMVLFSVSSANRNWGKWWSVRGSCRIRFISHGGLFWCCSLRMPLLHGNFLATDQCYEHILSLCDGMWVALEKHNPFPEEESPGYPVSWNSPPIPSLFFDCDENHVLNFCFWLIRWTLLLGSVFLLKMKNSQ